MNSSILPEGGSENTTESETLYYTETFKHMQVMGWIPENMDHRTWQNNEELSDGLNSLYERMKMFTLVPFNAIPWMDRMHLIDFLDLAIKHNIVGKGIMPLHMAITPALFEYVFLELEKIGEDMSPFTKKEIEIKSSIEPKKNGGFFKLPFGKK